MTHDRTLRPLHHPLCPSPVRSAAGLLAAATLLTLGATASPAAAQGAPPAPTVGSPPPTGTAPGAAAPVQGTQPAQGSPPAQPPPGGGSPPPGGQPSWGAPPPHGDPGGWGAVQPGIQDPGGQEQRPGQQPAGASGHDLSARYPDYPPGYAPRKIPSDGGAPPPGYQLGSEPRRGLWVTGAGLLGGIYLATFLAAGTAVSEGEDDMAPLFIPIAGPWITVRSARDGDELRVPLVMSGIGQLAGAGLLIGGLVAQREVFVRSDAVAGTRVTTRVAVGPGNVSMLGQF